MAYEKGKDERSRKDENGQVRTEEKMPKVGRKGGFKGEGNRKSGQG